MPAAAESERARPIYQAALSATAAAGAAAPSGSQRSKLLGRRSGQQLMQLIGRLLWICPLAKSAPCQGHSGSRVAWLRPIFARPAQNAWLSRKAGPQKEAPPEQRLSAASSFSSLA